MRFYRVPTPDKPLAERIESTNAPLALRRGFVPSVTTILSILRHEHLENWLVKNCLEHYEQHGDFKAALAYRDTTGADFGTVCHALMESFLRGQTCIVEHDHRHRQACGPLFAWLDNNIETLLFCEAKFADKGLGYGGTADLLVMLHDGRQILLDMKTAKNHANYPMRSTPIHRYQLAAYRKHFEAVYGPMHTGILLLANPFGSRPQPAIQFVDYQEQDWYAGFQAARHLWLEHYGGPFFPLTESPTNRGPLSKL